LGSAKKSLKISRLCQALIILATWEAEIRRIVFYQLGKKGLQGPISTETKNKKLGMLVSTCHSATLGSIK
jgi:hypothetical protein